MNIFLLNENPLLCAEQHCDKHVVKMVIEYAQLMSTAHRYLDGELYGDLTEAGRKIKRWRHPNSNMESTLYKASHVNHPDGLWVRSSSANYDYLYDLLQRVGLADKSHIKVSKLSIGEKQRVAVARAFAGKPKWVFCDEPTSSLDDKNTDIIINLIKEESLRCKASLILKTHDKRIQSILNFDQILKLGE